MAKTLCVFLCICVSLHTVIGQFGFFQPRPNQNEYYGQNFFQAPNRFRETLQGFFNQNRHRPHVINHQQPQENVYVIEIDDNNQNSESPSVEGNVKFPTTTQGGQQLQPVQGGQPLQPVQGGQPLQPVQGTDFQFGNGNGFVNFNNNQQAIEQAFYGNQNGGNNEENDNTRVGENDAVNFEEKTEAPKAAELTPVPTLTELTPVPTVKTESRNNFNFNPVPVFGETCDPVEGGLGSCISIYDCPPYLKILQEARAQATQILRQAHCGFDGNNPKVCCPRPGIPTVAPTEATTTTTTTTTRAIVKAVTDDFVAALPDPPECGFSNASFSRVVGGVKAKLDDFPWMALLGYKTRRGGTSWLCGGSLISSKHVLTAAHCIHNHEDDLYVVRLGELDLAREDEGAHPIDVLIKQKIKHEQYNAQSFTSDIAVLLLADEVTYTNSIKPICIPKDSELRARSFEDYNPLIAGWGHTEFRGPSATHLQVLQLPVVSNEFCSQAYSQYKAQVIDERVLCAGYKNGGKDACQGDSGGPLMQPIWSSTDYKTYFYQIGVVSYGKKCAEAGFPGVYSRITHFVPWIEKTVLGHEA